MMKYLIFCFLSAFILLAFTSSQKESEKQPVTIPKIELLTNDKGFGWQQDILLFNGQPYSGYVIEKYINGQDASKNAYFNGKLEGKQEKWFENGAKMEFRFYKENRKVGLHEGWYANGQKRFEYFIENDIPIKTHREWYQNGQLYSLSNYDQEGQPEGEQKMWFESGQIKSNYIIKDGRRFGFLGAKGCMGEGEKKTVGLKFEK
jgi:antitoxin component YwqK of YwqJK toxin-antitoxin module